MTFNEQLSDVFDKGIHYGTDSLTPHERELFLIQDFIIEYEMGGLSSFLYNRLPDVDGIHTTIKAMQQNRLTALADLMAKVIAIFDGYAEPDESVTWQQVLRQYDPGNQLNELDQRIQELSNYGIV